MSNCDWSLSASKLNVFNECQRCFWDLNVAKVAVRPELPFPTLPNGFDRVMKAYFDQYRGSLPPVLRHRFDPAPVLWGTLEEIQKCRHWRSNLKCVVPTPYGRISIISAFDDRLYWHESGLHASLDIKSKGDRPKDDGRQYYQTQIDVYDLVLNENGCSTVGKGYLLYGWPTAVTDGVGILWDFELVALEASRSRVLTLIAESAKVLGGPRPEPSAACPHCAVERARRSLDPPGGHAFVSALDRDS